MIRTVKKMKSNKTLSPEDFKNRVMGWLNRDMQQRKNAEAQAIEYFSHKERKAYYAVEGYDILDKDSQDSGFIHLSDEEVERIEELVVKEINRCFSEHFDEFEKDPVFVNTTKDAFKYKPLSFFFEQNDELRSLLELSCIDEGLYPTSIDLEKRYYFYRFSYAVYDTEKDYWCTPNPIFLYLEDDECITLIRYILENPKGFCFNQLLRKDKELASKISSMAYSQIYGFEDEDIKPFILLFAEAEEDAKIINETT